MIDYPRKTSEFEVQAQLYMMLRSLGYDARGEVKSNKNRSRYDIVIFVNYKPALIIEVKNKKHIDPNYDTKQTRKYKTTGVPVIVCQNMAHIDNTVNHVLLSLPRVRT